MSMIHKGKHASILAHLSMSRNLKDEQSTQLNKRELELLPEELQVVGAAILNDDLDNEEAKQYILWADSLRIFRR